MGYKIVYEKDPPKRFVFFRIQVFCAAFLLLFVLLARVIWPEGTETLRKLLVSEQLSHGAQAVAAMIEGLEAGESLSDVVEVFCQEIIHGN